MAHFDSMRRTASQCLKLSIFGSSSVVVTHALGPGDTPGCFFGNHGFGLLRSGVIVGLVGVRTGGGAVSTPASIIEAKSEGFIMIVRVMMGQISV